MIAIIGAMAQEVKLLANLIQNPTEKTIAGVRFIRGWLEGKQIVLLQSGVGKVNAAISTTLLHQLYSPTKVINIGSAGGLTTELNVGDVIISSETVHHDVDATAINLQIGELPDMPIRYASDAMLIKKMSEILPKIGINYKIGLIGTGDSFIADQVRTALIKKHFPDILAVEMEAAAIAQVCYRFGTPFIVVRALSDIPDQESPLTFIEYLDLAANNSAKIVIELLKAID